MLNFKFNRGELEGSPASPKKIRNKKKNFKNFSILSPSYQTFFAFSTFSRSKSSWNSVQKKSFFFSICFKAGLSLCHLSVILKRTNFPHQFPSDKLSIPTHKNFQIRDYRLLWGTGLQTKICLSCTFWQRFFLCDHQFMNMRTYLLLTHRYRLLMNLIMIILDNSIIFHTEPGQVWLCQLLDIFQRHHFSANSAKQRYFPETPFQWYLEIPKQNREEQRPSDCRARVAELVKGKGLSLLSSIKLFKLFSSSNFTLMFLNREKLVKVFSWSEFKYLII